MAAVTSNKEKLELINGDIVELTLNFKKLLWLRANGRDKEVKAAMQCINGKEPDMLEMPYMFWAAYLCANDTPKYTEDEFFELLPWDLEETAKLFNNLNSKKKI